MARTAVRATKIDYNVNERKPHAIDIHVGKRIRMRRCLQNLSQEKLADAVGLTFQQIQKYENGANRVSASRLYQFSKILSVPIDYFYQEYVEVPGGRRSRPFHAIKGSGDNGVMSEDMLYSKDAIELLKIFYGIKDGKKRKDFLKLISTMSETMSG